MDVWEEETESINGHQSEGTALDMALIAKEKFRFHSLHNLGWTAIARPAVTSIYGRVGRCKWLRLFGTDTRAAEYPKKYNK